ncbi:anti-phage Hailong system effector protein HalA [Paraburkholderia sp. D1E]|uniref:anti-phage Hailong system effector protein HalA n=1 Tax=Paraburkholderia sp. D1E TaxID=3461398 RepID=UPI0040468595
MDNPISPALNSGDLANPANSATPVNPAQHASGSITPEIVVLRVRGKRTKSYWEPVFNPNSAAPVAVYDWDVTGKTGIQNQLCRAFELAALMRSRAQTRWPVSTFAFADCDFEGQFADVTFKNCTFVGCDFGSCSWKNAKFSNCEFKKCSFTMTTFEQSQFITCKWEKIGISGTETKFFDTSVSNPLEFIAAAWTNLDSGVLSQFNKDALYQTMRLEQTKTKVARLILSNNERSGDDATYYRSVETYLRQIIRSKQIVCKYNIKNRISIIVNIASLLLFYVESVLLRISGTINNWGASVARPAVVGLIIAAAFAGWYYFAWRFFLGMSPPLKETAMKSFDVTLLFGYTKHALAGSRFFEQTSYAINAFLGLWWYAIFVPTVINRISRVR